MKQRACPMTQREVLALLAGRLTQFRRVVMPQPECEIEGAYFDAYNGGPQWNWWTRDDKQCNGHGHIQCPFGRPGDGLRFQETCKSVTTCANTYRTIYKADGKEIHIQAEGHDDMPDDHHWRPSTQMPRWASRPSLARVVAGVRVERVQEISEADAKAGGIERPYNAVSGENYYTAWIDGKCIENVSAATVFMYLWNSRHAKPKPYRRNPYTGKPELCMVAYPWDDVRTQTVITRKASKMHGCRVYVVGNPFVWVTELNP